MGYPHAVATGNAVIAAALAYVSGCDHLEDPEEIAERHVQLADAVYDHVNATAVEHVQGPDIDEAG